MELHLRSAANHIMETKLNELVQQLVNGFEEQLEELRKENEMLIRLVWKWETGTAIPCSYCGRTLTDEELADEHNKGDNSKKSLSVACPKCRVLFEGEEKEEDSEGDDFDYNDSCDCCVKGWSKANEYGRCVCRCDCGKLQRICRYKCSN